MKDTVLATFLLVILLTPLQAQEWLTDMDHAREKSLNSGKNIVLVFSGSDWCAPCIRLEKEIWSNQLFQQLAQDHFIFVRADFPRRKQNQLTSQQQSLNNKLAEKYNQSGSFPLVVVVDGQGRVLGQTGYLRYNPEQYFSHLTSFE